jgi:hypothetical protein
LNDPSISNIIEKIIRKYDFLKVVVLHVKCSIDIDYTELNDELFKKCEKSYVKLKDNYKIAVDNPIIVKGWYIKLNVNL